MKTKWVRRAAKPMVLPCENKQGFTSQEQIVHEKLMDCYSAILHLPQEHPDELRDFVDAVHRMQDLLGMRIVRRVYPDGWPTYEMVEEP